MFNKHYMNIVDETSVIAIKNLANPLDPKLDEKTIREIIENYQNHPRIIKVSEYPSKMRNLKTIFCWFTVLLFEYNEGKTGFFN